VGGLLTSGQEFGPMSLEPYTDALLRGALKSWPSGVAGAAALLTAGIVVSSNAITGGASSFASTLVEQVGSGRYNILELLFSTGVGALSGQFTGNSNSPQVNQPPTIEPPDHPIVKAPNAPPVPANGSPGRSPGTSNGGRSSGGSPNGPLYSLLHPWACAPGASLRTC